MKSTISLSLVLLPLICLADIWYVHPGQSIQSAADSAADGDTLIIHDGAHTETVVLSNRELTIASLFLLDGDSAHIPATVWQPNFAHPDTQSCLAVLTSNGQVCRVVGVSFGNGQGTRMRTNYTGGGAIFVNRGHLRAEDCLFQYCSADLGGSVFVDGSNLKQAKAILQGCRFENGFAHLIGGAIYSIDCTLRVQQSHFADNEAVVSTGGLSVWESYAEIVECSFTRCSGGQVGAADVADTDGLIVRCVFWNNYADMGVFTDLSFADGNAVISQCSFLGCDQPAISMVLQTEHSPLRFLGNFVTGYISPDHSTGTVLIPNNTRGEIAYCVFSSNVNVAGGPIVAFNRTHIRLHHNAFESNISLDSLSGSVLTLGGAPVSLDSNIITGNRGRIINQYGAQRYIIDARNNWWGDASGPYHPVLNPAGRGDTLLSDSVLFIPWLTEPPDTSMPSAIARPRPEFAATWRLAAVYPNPFNSEVRLIIAGFTRGDFRLTLHNLLGQEVDVLHTGALTGGELLYRAPSGLASGVYFVNASGGGFMDTRKVVLIR